MADVKWIKITTDIFDDEKILLIESLPDAYAIITVWFKLLCLAGKQNNSGVFMLGHIAYTDKMLATIFRMKESTVTLALNTFEQFGMVQIVDGVITIPNWGKHQSLDSLESKKEYMRNYMNEYRAKQKALTAGEKLCKTNSKANSKANVSRTDKERDKEKEENKEIIRGGKENPTPATQTNSVSQEIVNLFNEICVSFPSVRTISESRKKALKARLKTYTVEDFKQCFENAEASSFLKGGNNRNWSATFDWIITDSNMAKVLEGNYNDKPGSGNSSFDEREFINAAMQNGRRMLDEWAEKDPPKTAGDDENIRARAEALQKELAGK